MKQTITFLFFLALSACSSNHQNNPLETQLVTEQDIHSVSTIGDKQNQFQIFSYQGFQDKVADEVIRPVSGYQPKPNSLILGYPEGLIGEQNIFGGVITKVSGAAQNTLGVLKLADIPPIHVQTRVFARDSGRPSLHFRGCLSQCTERSNQKLIMAVPIVGFSPGRIMVDLSAIGSRMNLLGKIDPEGSFTHLRTKQSVTSAFDYSGSTLVFDNKATMIPMRSPFPGETLPESQFVTRWYLRLASGFNPAFEVRSPTEGVGFFTTKRAKKKRIVRFSQTVFGSRPVHYYLKNFPPEHHRSIAKGINSWNSLFYDLFKRDLISYEFVGVNDPRGNHLIAGDVRFNIIEWDLNNSASYLGLASSIANQFSGEIMAAHILVQGPKIVTVNKEWFQISHQVQQLRSLGLGSAADQIILDFKEKLGALGPQTNSMVLKLTNDLEFRIVGQLPSHLDPMFRQEDFVEPPVGVTYQEFMDGFLQNLITHEVGHTLGLRHNFKGSLGADDIVAEGKTSRSIMEYLARSYGFLKRIAEYDVMAIGYGYGGITPQHTTWFCTDEDVAHPESASHSAECSRDDSTNDGYGYFRDQVSRVVELITKPGEIEASVWSLSALRPEFSKGLKGMLFYASTALKTGKSWTNFFGRPHRPASVQAVKPYVLQDIQSILCHRDIETAINEKREEADRIQTRTLVDRLRILADSLRASVVGLGSDSLACDST